MRIGIDGRELLNQRTGVGRYLAALCNHWTTISPRQDIEFILYTPTNQSQTTPAPPFDTTHPSIFTHRPVPGRPGTWWEQVQLPAVAKHDGLDVFFAPAYSAPLRLIIPTVVTMHDVSFAAHPEWFHWREGARRRWLAQQTMARARAVIAVSNFSRNEILNHFNVTPTRIHVVRSGIDVPPIGRRHLTGALILYVGSIFNRRHLPTLIQALRKVRAQVPDARLTIVGDDRTYPKQHLPALAEEIGVLDSTIFRAYVPDDELAALYTEASVFAFLSEYEGFGLTPLEALSAGVPIVVGDTAVARELYADAALYVPLGDVAATADALVALLTDTSLRRRQQDRADALLIHFNWSRTAQETLALLTDAGGTGR